MTDELLSFLARLKQHHLYGVVVAYAVVVGFLIQLVSRAFPYFGWTAAVAAEAVPLARIRHQGRWGNLMAVLYFRSI